VSLVESVEVRLRSMASPEQVDLISKRVPREQVIGVRMRDTFALAREHRRADLDDVRLMLRSPRYEVRVVGVNILDARARLAPPSAAERTALFDLHPATAAQFEHGRTLHPAARRAAAVGRRAPAASSP
jgi:hypothetical protein